ncbi:MAG: SulP family inorganic anion transporter, partial [Janthinobacterium lividum]
SGLFGGMGGCAMIGQTMINLGSGGRSRLSGATSGVMILLFILFLSPLIERIPLAALVGVMFVVAQQTFAWGSLRVLGKVPRSDALVIVAVTVVTVFTDLAIAVLCGIVIAALNFAWQHARDIRVESESESESGSESGSEARSEARSEADSKSETQAGAPDEKTYVAHGTLFFASTTRFQELFDPARDPQRIVVDCRHLHLADHSAIAALEALHERYRRAGKQVRLLHLSARNQLLLARAGAAV